MNTKQQALETIHTATDHTDAKVTHRVRVLSAYIKNILTEGKFN
jgi:hypothetical protein